MRSNHPHTPRTVLGQDVTAGAVLTVPPAAGTTGVQLADGEVLRSALAVISLLENDETPQHVVVAAYDSYVRELPAAIARHLLDLSSDDQDTVDAAKAAVRAEVSAAVKSAGAGEMTSWEKFKVGIGSLNLDDQVGSAFDDTTTTKPIALDFVETSGSGSSARTTQDWHLTGTLTVDTRIDLCAAQVRAANQAKVHRDQLLDQLRSLRTARGQARGAEREALDLDIAELEPVLEAAEAELAAAQAALAACRAGGGVVAGGHPSATSTTSWWPPTCGGSDRARRRFAVRREAVPDLLGAPVIPRHEPMSHSQTGPFWRAPGQV